jgi:hypothetical protein
LESLALATEAPNHKMTWPWRFFVLGPVVWGKMADLMVEAKLKKETTANPEKLKEKFFEGGALVAVGIVRSQDLTRAKEDYAALAGGLQNAALYLWEQGYGAKWSTGGFTMGPAAYSALDLDPQNIELCGLFRVGKFLQPGVRPKRPSITEFVKHLE